jgi:YD repeat-containing protein
VPTPGPNLSIARSFQPTVSGRNETGPFGLGWVSNWDIRASTDSYGNVTINYGGGLRYFTLQSDGSYLASAGDTGTLATPSGGGYQLTEVDGSLTAFNANGTLNYVQDSNGNRITAGYNACGQLVSLTESDRDALTLRYNSQGFVSQVTDPAGETASYAYDSAGHLLSVTTPQGTTTYKYVTGTGTPANNALQTILNPDGTQINYSYDNEGRLSGSFYGTAANPLRAVKVSYLSPGGISYTDASGNKTTVQYTNLGQPVAITDPLGNTIRLSYNPSGDLTNVMLTGGTTYSYTYDLKDNRNRSPLLKLQKLVDRGGPAHEYGEAGLAAVHILFHEWHLFRGGGGRAALQRDLEPLREAMRSWLGEGARCGDAKASALCANLLVVEPALWTFLYKKGVEPTNNHMERLLQGSGGTHQKTSRRGYRRAFRGDFVQVTSVSRSGTPGERCGSSPAGKLDRFVNSGS